MNYHSFIIPLFASKTCIEDWSNQRVKACAIFSLPCSNAFFERILLELLLFLKPSWEITWDEHCHAWQHAYNEILFTGRDHTKDLEIHRYLLPLHVLGPENYKKGCPPFIERVYCSFWVHALTNVINSRVKIIMKFDLCLWTLDTRPLLQDHQDQKNA